MSGSGKVVDLVRPAAESSPNDSDLSRLDPNWTLVPPGKYEVAFVSAAKVRLNFREVWTIDFRIVSLGVGFGWPIRGHVAAVKPQQRLTPSMKYVGWYSAATLLKPPKHLHQIHPRSFLADRSFLVKVRTVERDRDGNERPEALHYSVVQTILKQTAGPPASGWRDHR